MAGNLTAMIAAAFAGSAVTADPYYEYTTLLLPGNGTNGAQNNTFLDGSTNNFTITRNGNTTQGTFSPFSQTGWGNYFSGSSALSTTSNAAFNFSTGSFTLECWFNKQGSGGSSDAVGNLLVYTGGGGNNSTWLGITDSGTIIGKVGFSGSWAAEISGGSVSNGTWNHVALVRNSTGNTLTLYLNGSSIASTTNSTDLSTYGTNSSIAVNLGSTRYFNGYISNARIVKGVAVYTGTFTPPTSALAATQSAGTNISAITGTQTSLLTCQSNRFIDNATANSGSGFAITLTGSPSVQAFSPFNPTSSWSATTNGGSGYFDGSGDYLATPSNSALAVGAGDFCIETWIYWGTSSVNDVIYSNVLNSGGGDAQIEIYINSSNKVVCGGWNTNFLVGSTNITSNAWTHIAVCRSGTTMSLFLNGSRDATTTTSNNFSSTNAFNVGRQASGAYDFLGYISNLRVVKGSSVYDPTQTTLTVPTAPLTAISGTSLLTCQSNRFIDNSSNTFAITVNGNTSVQAFSPFNPTSSWSATTNGGSGYFDGSGDYLSVADNSNLRFGTNAFTIQGWIYRNASGAAHSIIAKGGASTGFVLQVTSTNILRFTHGTTNVDTTTTIPASAWTHIAAVRTNTSTNGFQLYINGVSSATATVSTDFNQTDTLYIGADRGAANVMNGYISGLKYTNGTAESISVPTEPPTSTTNVVLLLNFTNAGIYDATSKNDLETVGNAQISTTQSKFGGSSMSFDGTGDYLTGPTNTALNTFGTGPFTVETWVYPTATKSASSIFDTLPLNGAGLRASSYAFSISSSNKAQIFTNGTAYTSSGSISLNTWTHIAFVREGTGTNQTKIYINGVNDGTFTTTTNDTLGGLNVGVAADVPTNSSYMFQGYMQDLRITKGYARYTANFTPPTAAFFTL